jgi:hypothetical protein
MPEKKDSEKKWEQDPSTLYLKDFIKFAALKNRVNKKHRPTEKK